jgi:hypothetical protein
MLWKAVVKDGCGRKDGGRVGKGLRGRWRKVSVV